MRRLLIMGAGGYGRTIADVATQMGRYDAIAFLDDRQVGSQILGTCADYASFLGWDLYPAFGDNAARRSWLERLMEEGIPVPTIVHPGAYISPTARIGAGTVVLPHAMVGTAVTVGTGCIVNMGAIIDHDCVIGDYCHISPGAIVKAENRIPTATKIDSGEVIPNRAFL